MCMEMHVTLPTVQSFLLMYPLRCGCITILIWTLFRSFFCLFFFVVVLLQAFVEHPSPVGWIFVEEGKKAWSDENVYQVFYSFIALIIAEAFLFIFCYYLAFGIYNCQSRMIAEYLVCRFATWLIELVVLFVLAFVHKLLIGWYLVMLLFVILEFYAFVIVYSYYAELYDEDKNESGDGGCKPCESDCL